MTRSAKKCVRNSNPYPLIAAAPSGLEQVILIDPLKKF